MIQNLLIACSIAAANVAIPNITKDYTKPEEVTTTTKVDTYYMKSIGDNAAGTEIYSLEGGFYMTNNFYQIGGVFGEYRLDNYEMELSTYFTARLTSQNISNLRIHLYLNATYTDDAYLQAIYSEQINISNKDEEYLTDAVLNTNQYFLTQNNDSDDLDQDTYNMTQLGYTTGTTTLINQYIDNYNMFTMMADGVARQGHKMKIYDVNEFDVYTSIKYIEVEYTLTYGDQEVIDLPGLMFTILGMPFGFISQAFDLTLFPGTQYAVNVSNILFAIITALIIIVIVKKVLK